MKIVVDPGHGGADGGGRSLVGNEKNIVLVASAFLWKHLADLRHTVMPTRVSDVFVELGERAAYANEMGADLFVSVHANAGVSTARGPWTIYARGSTSGEAMAKRVQAALAGAADHGSPRAFYPDKSDWVDGRRLAVLHQTRMPAILLELGFMTHAAEAVRLNDADYLSKLMRAVATAIHAAP